MVDNFNIKEEIKTTSYDENGNPILTTSSTHEVGQLSDGTEFDKKENQTVQLQCGLQHHPAMASSQNPNPIYVTTCAICRDPKLTKKTSHGLVSLSSSRNCSRCGKTLCPNHSRELDNKHYCIRPCAKIHKLKRFLNSIFFREDD